uniref:Ring finger and CCCH-type domains 2 n=3 Tax=Nothobranchius rachovii TaxID=451742 RepID=A0A1A8PRC0_9TELE
MPVQAAQWTEFLSCPICYNEFDSRSHQPISLGCSHTVCKTCLHKLHRKACPFDQTPISTDIDLLPVNCALLQLVGAPVPDVPPVSLSSATDVEHYEVCRLCVEELALYLKPISSAKAVANLTPSMLSRPMQRKLVTLVNCQLVEEEGRVRAPPLRERFNSLDNYCSGAEHRAALHRDFGRVPLGYEGLYKRKQDQWTSIHHHHNPSRPSQSSPIFTDFGAEHVESSGGQCMGCRIRNEESLAHYPPWSYGSTGSSLSPFEPEALTHTSAHSCSKHPELDGTEGEAVSRKQWLHTLDHYRRLKEEDPIIPFSEAPIISKWGAISRASRTVYHNTDPVQATSCQGGANTTPINFKDYNHHLDHGDYRWGSRGSDSSSHSSFLESEHLCTSELDGRRTSISGEKIVSDLQVRHPTFSQDRNQAGSEQDPDRDIELELSALDLEDSDQHETNLEESLNLHSPPSQDASHLLPPPCSSPLRSSPVDEHSKTQRLTTEKVDPHLQKKMAFRKSMSPGGLASGGLGIGKLVLRTGPPQLGNASNRVCSETPGTEMLLNGS